MRARLWGALIAASILWCVADKRRLGAAIVALLALYAVACVLILLATAHHPTPPCLRVDPQDEPAGQDWDGRNCRGVP